MRNLNKDVNMTKLERWLGQESIDRLRLAMNGWYGRPINIIDLPGSVWIDAQGNFRGHLRGGEFASALDSLEDHLKRYAKSLIHEAGNPAYGQLNVGFTSISDALSRASGGFSQRRNFNKVGATGVVGGSSSLWRLGAQPAAGAVGAAAPAGTVHVGSNTGALTFANPEAGSNRLVGADVGSSVLGNTIMVYDRLFAVAKTMNSTTTEAVTGVPTRYQSTVTTNEDYAGDNFLAVEVGGTALAATAHNWTTCLYTNQAGTASQTLPSLTGNSGAIVDRLDHPLNQWFAPLASGDSGIQNLTQMQCSAAVATGVINFMIGHPIGFMSFPVINALLPFDWLTNRDQAPRIFDNACLAMMEVLKPTTTATTYTGRIATTSTAS